MKQAQLLCWFVGGGTPRTNTDCGRRKEWRFLLANRESSRHCVYFQFQLRRFVGRRGRHG
jgi:hypothetical protein